MIDFALFGRLATFLKCEIKMQKTKFGQTSTGTATSISHFLAPCSGHSGHIFEVRNKNAKKRNVARARDKKKHKNASKQPKVP
jgi:hypothetical protein